MKGDEILVATTRAIAMKKYSDTRRNDNEKDNNKKYIQQKSK